MPTRPQRISRRLAERAAYTRTNADLLTAGSYPSYADIAFSTGPGIDPSGQPPIWWMGLDSGGGDYPIGPHGPYQNRGGRGLPVVTRATSLITGPLTAAPFRVLTENAIGETITPPRWLTDPMLLRPDARFADAVYPEVVKLPRGEFWAEWIRSAIHFGTGAFICTEDAYGMPLAGTMRIVNPLLLSTDRADDGSLRWVLGADDAYSDRAVFSRDGRITLGAVTYRIVTLRNPHSSVDAEGHSMGVFEQSPSAFRLGSQIDQYASGTFRSGVPAGFLKVQTPNLSQESADELRASWLRHHGGDRRSIAVLSSTIDFTPLNMSPVDAALGEVTRLNIGEIAYAFGLDPEVLGVTMSNSGTYKNAQEFWSRHRDFGLAPWIAAVQDVLTSLLSGIQQVVVNMDGFANPPASERFAAYKTAIDAGILLPDEARALEGLPPLPEPEPVPPQLQAVEDNEPTEADVSQQRARPQPWRQR